MSLRPTYASMVMLSSGLLTLTLAVYVWRRQGTQGRRSLAVVIVAASVWSIAYALETAATTAATAELWGDLKYLGILLLPPAWLVFTLTYTGQERWLRRWTIALLAVEPAIVLVLLALPSTDELIRFYPPGEPAGGLFVADHGPGFWVHFAYTNALLIFSTALFAVSLIRVSRFYRGQSAVILVGIALPWVANILNNFHVSGFARVDVTPVAFSVAGVFLVWGVFRLRLLDIIPVAHPRIIETMRDAVLVLDPFERVVDVNPAAEHLLGCRGADAIGRPASLLVPSCAGLLERHQGADHATEELRLTRDGESRHCELTVSWLTPASGGRRASFLVLRDITERKRAEESLERLAHYDVLTGLPNRKLAADRLSQTLTRARRNGELVALLMLDLDRFKLVNDSLGHDVGDLLLQQVAGRLLGCLREQDTVSRLGGDEFTVILPDLAHPDDAAVVAVKMLDALRPPFEVAGWELRATASIGVAIFPADGPDPPTLLRRADAAMYRAKAGGKDRYELWEPLPTAISLDRRRLGADLRGALERAELRVEFQTATALADGRVAAVEALVRWDHPERGRLGPASFLPLAEEQGEVVHVGHWVLTQSCAHAARWGRRGWAGPVAVNLSGRQLADPELTTRIDAALEESGLHPDRLMVEVSERILNDDAVYETTIHKLKQLGVGVALDDFGTGAATLSQLRRLPFDQLKLDPVLVRGVARHPDDRVAVAATINLAHTLGLDVVAEGVELEDQRAVLQDLGCDAAQGFLFLPPLPPERLAGRLLGRPV